MKVKAFLNKLMLSSDIDNVRVEKNGYTQAEYGEDDVRFENYGFWGNETVKTFRISKTHCGIVLVINV